MAILSALEWGTLAVLKFTKLREWEVWWSARKGTFALGSIVVGHALGHGRGGAVNEKNVSNSCGSSTSDGNRADA